MTDLVKKTVDPDLVVVSDHKSPVSIEGTAMGRVRGSDATAYYAVYKVGNRLDRIPVNKELYDALRLLFSTIKSENRAAILEWVNSPSPGPIGPQSLMD